MTVFLERFLIPLCATSLIGVVVINPIKLSMPVRVLLVLVIVGVAIGASWALHNRTSRLAHAAPTTQPVPYPALREPSRDIEIKGSHCSKTFVLRVGDYQDFVWENNRLRVEVKAIVTAAVPGRLNKKEVEQAKVHLRMPVTDFHGGEETTSVGWNDFLVPRSSGESGSISPSVSEKRISDFVDLLLIT